MVSCYFVGYVECSQSYKFYNPISRFFFETGNARFLKDIVSGDPKYMIYKLNKSIYSLKQASRQWNHKFHQVITSYGFQASVIDDYVYQKFIRSKYIFLVLYVDDILLASNDIGLPPKPRNI